MQFKRLSLNGFTYIGLLIVITIAGIGLAVVGELWYTEMQREREKELIFIGLEYKDAIASYYSSTPNGVMQLPKTLDELLADKRLPIVKRHLRKLYLDPMTGKSDWGLIMQQGAIAGVFSLSESKPIKKFGFPHGYEDFERAEKYRDWQFIYNR